MNDDKTRIVTPSWSRRKFLKTGVAVGAAGLAAGAHPKASKVFAAPAVLQGEPVTLDYLTWFYNEPGRGDAWKEMIADFEASQSDIKINMTGWAFDDFTNNIIVQLQAGKLDGDLIQTTPDLVLRLTTDASVTAVIEETPFFLDDMVTLILGPDETLQGAVGETGRRFAEETAAYWREWVRYLSIPYEWQEAVIRAAITLKLNAYDDTGAIVAAMTTSIPEAANSGRNWDYRYCWLRDGYFVVNALNRLGTTQTMERYLGICGCSSTRTASRVRITL